MACWKARVDLLLTVIELLFLSLTVSKLTAFLEGVGQFEPRFQGEEVDPRESFLFLEN